MKKRRTKISWNRFDPEERYYIKLAGPRKTEPSASNVFCRLNNRHRRCNATHLAAAGYPMAVLRNLAPWNEVHRWCGETFRNTKGRTYTWTGQNFWFQTEADRDLFISKWGNQ